MWGEKMELRILDAIQRLHNPALDWFMCFITGFGNFGVFWLLVVVVLMHRAGPVFLCMSEITADSKLCILQLTSKMKPHTMKGGGVEDALRNLLRRN